MGAMSARWASISRESAKCCSTRSSYRALTRTISVCNRWSLETGPAKIAVILSASSLVAAELVPIFEVNGESSSIFNVSSRIDRCGTKGLEVSIKIQSN